MRAIVYGLLIVLVAIVFWLKPAESAAQAQQPPQVSQQPPFSSAPPKTDDPIIRDMERKNAEARNKARYQSLKADTDRLLQLATELKQSVDKANENTLSLDVIKKAEQVEKLAKQVKEKMKG